MAEKMLQDLLYKRKAYGKNQGTHKTSKIKNKTQCLLGQNTQFLWKYLIEFRLFHFSPYSVSNLWLSYCALVVWTIIALPISAVYHKYFYYVHSTLLSGIMVLPLSVILFPTNISGNFKGVKKKWKHNFKIGHCCCLNSRK